MPTFSIQEYRNAPLESCANFDQSEVIFSKFDFQNDIYLYHLAMKLVKKIQGSFKGICVNCCGSETF